MKTKIPTWTRHVMLLTVCSSVFFTSCEEDEKTKTLPEVTTAAVSDVTSTSAIGGGEIVSDGNAEITASGLVYSSTNTTPTLADSKTEETTTDGSFTSTLEGLASNTTYHVRAYATNNVGTGYGEVVEFMTGNAAPVATDVDITFTGDLGFEVELTASYTYSDEESDAEEGTTFQWYIANDMAGAGEEAISGATESIYSIKATDEFKYIRVGVAPKAAAGTSEGVEVKSTFVGPIPEAPETVTFMYNGNEVTYAVITSSVTGRKWMDRNLGALKAADSVRDYHAYGDLFQWGRLADGHQLIIWTQNVTGGSNAPVNETTEENAFSSTDVPGHSLFIKVDGSVPGNWRNPQNTSLWKMPDYINNPCPSGWHIPTPAEWEAEHLETDFIVGSDIRSLSSSLKLTTNGRRNVNGELIVIGQSGVYWSSDGRTSSTTGNFYPYFYSFRVYTDTKVVENSWAQGEHIAAYGYACRCIKDE